MEEHLKLFQEHSEYQDFASGGTMVKPNVSYCIEQNEVHYNPIEPNYKMEYFTIVSLEDNNTIKWLAIDPRVAGYDEETEEPYNIYDTINYSLDNGNTWISFTPTDEMKETTMAVLQKGEKIKLFGNNPNYMMDTEACAYGVPYSDKTVNVQGNIMSLIYGHEFIGKTAFQDKNETFAGFFSPSGDYQRDGRSLKVVNAKNLILPATTLKNGCYRKMFAGSETLLTAPKLPATELASSCYQQMFAGCEGLTTAPVLPAETLVYGCYSQMFYLCVNLNSVACLATSMDRYSTTDWLNGVATSGTFTKAASMENWTVGVDGIPEGWTVQNATE